ncbi:hypothetical protein V2J09_004443, partial [Rumex salicifolius]
HPLRPVQEPFTSLEVYDHKLSCSDGGSGSSDFRMESGKRSILDGGVPDLESGRRSPEVNVEIKEKKSRHSCARELRSLMVDSLVMNKKGEEIKSKYSCARELRSLLLDSTVARRRFPRLAPDAEYGSNLLGMPNSSQQKACEMIRMRFGFAGLNRKSLRSRSVSYPHFPPEDTGKKRTKRLDSSRNSDLSEKSPAGKEGRSYGEDKSSANSEATGNSKRVCLSLARSKDETNEYNYHSDAEYVRCLFIGEPVPDAEARQRWPWRYEMEELAKSKLQMRKSFFILLDIPAVKELYQPIATLKLLTRRVKGRSVTVNDDEEDELVPNVECHYTEAQINEYIFEIGDCAYMRGDNGQKHIGRIVEFFRTTDEKDYCRVQWFYRAEDTVMKGQSSSHDEKRLFYSTLMNDNPLGCVISKLRIVQLTRKLNQKSNSSSSYDYYYDMEYCLDYSTFRTMPTEEHGLSSPIYSSDITSVSGTRPSEDVQICEIYNKELSLLDLYSGCGAMSTGLRLGTKMSGVDLATRWAVDFDGIACESLRMNHPKTQVRHGNAEDFLELLKQWEKLCKIYVLDDGKKRHLPTRKSAAEDIQDGDSVSDDVEFEVERLLDICYGDPDKSGKKGLKFKVRWKGYESDEDTWEPIDGLGKCEQHLCNFVTKGFKSKILPLPDNVDVICGGPPCQGISGYNRFRSVENPFDDDRNRQLQVYMDIVKFLKPRYVLMENVTDILKFDKGSLGRYALSRLVHMNYQARVGIMAGGCYGLPQFRLRVFFWGAQPTEDLPQFPLPTHDCIISYWPPSEFERNVVAYNEGQSRNLQDAVLLRDAISDLPAVGNDAYADEMPYGKPPETEFQEYTRLLKSDLMSGKETVEEALLYDHRPFSLHEDDYIRVCHVPRRKGANFRDLPGIIVGDDNRVRRDPTCDHASLPSGKPMVPDYALTFEQGRSKRPFGRLWWDETIPTVVTSPTCHSQVMLHPEQDRVLTVRECARLQGFPDHYRFCGTVKKRYRQIGNAVPIPVAKALGYALGMASQKLIGKEPIFELPPKFAYSYSLSSHI